MKSIGEHLKTAREEKGFSFDQVVHDTNISREYIHALEEDNFEFFPAEAYLIGFLRNYSEYLGLEPSKMVGIYKNFKISEEPVPMDLLLGKKKPAAEKKEQKEEFEISQRRFPKWLIPVVAMILVLGGVSFIFLPSFLNLDKDDKQVMEDPVQNEKEAVGPKEFFLTDETLDITVENGDKIKVSSGSKLVSFNVSISDEGKSLIYQDVENILKKIDLIKDEFQVVRIGDNNGVYFSVIKVSTASVTLIAQKVLIDESTNDLETAVDNDNNGITVSEERIAEKIVITSDVYPKAYTIDVFFRGDGLFRHKNDDQPSVERFYQAGERLKIDVNRTATLWVSNAGILDLKISGEEISLGENGQVVVRSVIWIKNNESGKYELVIIPIN
jgi:cytoskeleton protein RodZ